MLSFLSYLLSKRSPEAARRRAGRLRLSAYFGVLAVGAGMFTWSKAKAEVTNQAMAFGQDLLPILDLLDHPQKITLNGEPIFVATGIGDASVKESLDRMEKVCTTGDATIFKDAYNKAPAELAALGINANGVIRREEANKGVVACIAKPNGGATNVFDALNAFEKSGDLGEMGKLRYSYLAGTKDGKTRALTVWTDDHFRLSSFAIDEKKDAPGSDPTIVPRPADSQRYLSAQFDGTPYGVWIYSTARPAKEVSEFYDRKLHDEGWVMLQLNEGENRGRGFEKDGVEVILNVGVDAESKRTVVTLSELGSDQRAARARPSAP